MTEQMKNPPSRDTGDSSEKETETNPSNQIRCIDFNTESTTMTAELNPEGAARYVTEGRDVTDPDGDFTREITDVTHVTHPGDEGGKGFLETACLIWPNGLGQMIVDSAISDEVARARGYTTIHRPADAHELGFSNSESARLADAHQGLLVPIWDVVLSDQETGPAGYQMRPSRTLLDPNGVDGALKDSPKYVTPVKQPNYLDCNPLMQQETLNGSGDLWVTEGTKKVDSLATAGIPCIGLTGVSNWRGRERPGDKSTPTRPLPQWERIPLKGRRVVICFDSDAETNNAVKRARRGLGVYLSALGANVVYAKLPQGDGRKVGVDDFIASGKTVDDIPLHAPEDFDSEDVEAEKWAIKRRKYIEQRKAKGHEVNGEQLVQRVIDTLKRFVILPDEDSYVATALWVIHTHLVMKFDSTPRIAFLAPEKQCGKTRALEVVEPLVRNPDRFFNASPAVMYRTIEQHYDTYKHVTLLVDETDAIWPQRGSSADPSKEDIRAIVNAGHRKGSIVKRCEGQNNELKEFRVYAPVALAGIGTLPDTITDRAVVIKMRRRHPGERVEPFRMRKVPEIFGGLKTDIENWAMAHEHEFTDYYPETPEGVDDRPADVWEPLIAVADKTGWGRRAREACRHFVIDNPEEQQLSEGVRLLRDIRQVFINAGDPEQVPTDWTVERLCEIEDAPWNDRWFTQKRLAAMLSSYGIKSAPRQRFIIKGEVKQRNAYERHSFEDAWSRYCPPAPSLPRDA